MVLFVFLAVPKACPLTIIWSTQAVSGLAPFKTGTLAEEWEQGEAEKPPKGWCLSSDPDKVSGRRLKWSLLPMDNTAKQYLVQGDTHKPGQSVRQSAWITDY